MRIHVVVIQGVSKERFLQRDGTFKVSLTNAKKFKKMERAEIVSDKLRRSGRSNYTKTPYRLSKPDAKGFLDV